MKKAHKGLIAGGFIAAITGALGTVLGGIFLDKRKAKALGSGTKIAGDDEDMGAENDPIIDVAKTL